MSVDGVLDKLLIGMSILLVLYHHHCHQSLPTGSKFVSGTNSRNLTSLTRSCTPTGPNYLSTQQEACHGLKKSKSFWMSSYTNIPMASDRCECDSMVDLTGARNKLRDIPKEVGFAFQPPNTRWPPRY